MNRRIENTMGVTEQKIDTSIPAVIIEQANDADIRDIYALLGANQLPLDGFDDHIGATLVARELCGDAAPALVGNATLELYGRYALLRSVAVDQRLRGQGLGQKLTQAALNLAREKGISSVYLLTETAGEFFPKFGFEWIPRETVPAEVLQSVEFTTVCPTSALVMRKDLRETGSQTARMATRADAVAIARIYNQGIEDRTGTFETRPRSAEDILGWFDGVHPVIVVEEQGKVIAFASTSTYRPRECYSGIAEYSVYVAREARGRGAGRIALENLIVEAEAAGFWKLLSRIFPENVPSLALARSLGFREVGRYEKHAQLDGEWRDVIIVERLLDANLT